MPLFSPSRCVLLISDDGASVYEVGGSRTALIDNVPWETEGFEESLVQIIRRRCRGKPILVLNDMVEQHYRKERIPKVNSFDRANLIKRRLAAAFPSYPIRAGLKLKEKGALPSQGDKGVGGDVYLFAAVPVSENISKTLSVVRQSHSPVAGFSLLPVESSSMVHALSKKLSRNSASGTTSTWTVFVGQHRSGGLRQIVTKNGELALTRITPIIDTDSDPEAWASDVAGELKGTMSYLSRFGYDPADGLDVIVVSSHEAADAVTARIDFECNLTLMSAGEAANLLDIKVGRQEDQRYADILHVAWAGKKSSLTLPLQASALEQITKPAKQANAAAVLLVGICGYLAFTTFQETAAWTKLSGEIDDAKRVLSDTKVEHEAEVERKKAAGVDIVLIENATKIFSKLEAQAMKPLPVLDVIGRSLDPDLHIASLSIMPPSINGVAAANELPMPEEEDDEADAVDESEAPADDASSPTNVGAALPAIPPTPFEITLKMIFPGEIGPEVGIKETTDYEGRLRKNLPDHKVSIIKQVADLSYTGNFVGEATEKESANNKVEDFEAQILIKGALQ